MDKDQQNQVVQVQTPQAWYLDPYCQIFKIYVFLSDALDALV